MRGERGVKSRGAVTDAGRPTRAAVGRARVRPFVVVVIVVRENIFNRFDLKCF